MIITMLKRAEGAIRGVRERVERRRRRGAARRVLHALAGSLEGSPVDISKDEMWILFMSERGWL